MTILHFPHALGTVVEIKLPTWHLLRQTGKAREVEHTGVCDRRATPSGGMQWRQDGNLIMISFLNIAMSAALAKQPKSVFSLHRLGMKAAPIYAIGIILLFTTKALSMPTDTCSGTANQNLFAEVQFAYQQHKYDQALTALEQLENRCPRDDTVQLFFGQILAQTRNFNAAMGHLKKALELNPERYSAADEALSVYKAAQSEQQGILFFENFEKNHPGSYAAKCALAKAYIQKKRFRDAKTKLTQAIEINDSDEVARTLYIEICKELSEFNECDTLLADLVSKHPKDVDIRIDYINFLRRNEKRDQAVSNYKKLIDLTPEDSNMHYNFANLLTEVHRYDEAAKEFKAAELYASSPQPEDEIRLNFKHAVALIKGCRQKGKDCDRNNLELAIAKLTKVQRVSWQVRQQESYAPLFWLGLANHLLKNSDRAEVYFRQFCLSNEQNGVYDAETLMYLGEIYEKSDRYRDAAEAYKSVLKSESSDREKTLISLGRVLVAEGYRDNLAFNEAITVLEKVRDTPEGALYLARAYRNVRRSHEARLLLESALKKGSGDKADILRELALIYLGSRNEPNANNWTKKAETLLQKANRYEPNDLDIYIDIGYMYARSNNFNKARKYVSMAKKKGIPVSRYHMATGDVDLQEAKNEDEKIWGNPIEKAESAVQHLKEAYELKPSSEQYTRKYFEAVSYLEILKQKKHSRQRISWVVGIFVLSVVVFILGRLSIRKFNTKVYDGHLRVNKNTVAADVFILTRDFEKLLRRLVAHVMKEKYGPDKDWEKELLGTVDDFEIRERWRRIKQKSNLRNFLEATSLSELLERIIYKNWQLFEIFPKDKKEKEEFKAWFRHIVAMRNDNSHDKRDFSESDRDYLNGICGKIKERILSKYDFLNA